MMLKVACGNKTQCRHINWMITCHSNTYQLLFIKRLKQKLRGCSQRFKFFHKIFPLSIGCFRMAGPEIFVKTRQRSRIFPGEPQCAVGKYSFRINDMLQ